MARSDEPSRLSRLSLLELTKSLSIYEWLI